MESESTSMAMAYLANLAKFEPDEECFSRFSQKSHSHHSEIISDHSLSGLILEPSQSGNDLEPDNQILPIIVECWTPSGTRMVINADSPDHADWVKQMNPAPKEVVIVRCFDCTHSRIERGVAKCLAGVDSGLPTGGWWATDRHHCEQFEANP